MDPSQGKMPLTRAVPSAAEAGSVSAGGVTQRPGEDTPIVSAVVPTAEPLEDEVDNQENIISQVRVMSATYQEHLHAKTAKEGSHESYQERPLLLSLLQHNELQSTSSSLL